MKTAMKSNTLITLLLLITASCIARNVINELNSKEQFISLLRKNPTGENSCEAAVSLFQICSNTTVEGALIDYQSLITYCDGGLAFGMTINSLDVNKTISLYRFNASLLAACWPLVYNEYTITGNMYFGNSTVNGTANMCSNTCVSMSFSGDYEAVPNGSCYDVAVEAKLCA